MINYSIADKKHLPQILSLYRQLIPEEEPLSVGEAEKIWKEIEQANIKYFIATEDGKVIGSCYLAIIPNLTRQGRANGLIENVVTDQAHRRKGIGKKLIEMAMAYGEANNCYKIVLQSSVKRQGSHVFYEKCGLDGNSKRAFEKRL
jgi:GNAT superfamily N-acetyltransferase